MDCCDVLLFPIFRLFLNKLDHKYLHKKIIKRVAEFEHQIEFACHELFYEVSTYIHGLKYKWKLQDMFVKTNYDNRSKE